MIPKFLLDENLDPAVVYEVRRLDPSIDILYVGEPGAPPLSTSDPAVLDFCETERRILITNNRAPMPRHIADHLAAGKPYLIGARGPCLQARGGMVPVRQ